MTIRPATRADVPHLVAMVDRFRRSVPLFASMIADNPAQVASTMTRLVDGPSSVLLVVDMADVIVGMLGLLIYPHIFDSVPTATEVMWWVDPEVRGSCGVRLLHAGEAWARASGAGRLQMGAPNDRVAEFYERVGFTLVERSYFKTLAPAAPVVWQAVATQVRVADDVLPDALAYRQAALAQPFASVAVEPGLPFHGIADDTLGLLPRILATACPGLMPQLSFFRQSPEGQVEPHYIHTDTGMGDWTAILFLNPEPAPGDGTMFWKHRVTGDHAGDVPEETWADRTVWEPWLTVSAVFNRLVLFAAPLFHSRALEANYGEGETARLIQVVFGRGDFAASGV